MAQDPERSLSSGLSLPQWMKTKVSDGNSHDFDAQFASPPAHDDSFFLIRYPGASSLLSGGTKASAAPQVVQAPPRQGSNQTGVKDWSKHTQPCQQFIGGVPFGTLSKCPPTIKPKPAGTDDGFKGEGAACGSSIVRVAHKIINSRSTHSGRGVSVEPIHEEGLYQMTKGGEEASQGAAGAAKDPLAPSQAYLNMRRGSKSLPVTPLSSPPGSPSSKRKNNNVVNRFFTGPFELPPDITGSGSWMLAGLLRQQREGYTSTTHLEEEAQSSLAASVENLGPSPNADASKLSQQFSNNSEAPATKSQVYRPKPSELREMNFWSPTSM